jgi:nucleotide-binding universal stress UspA family protein
MYKNIIFPIDIADKTSYETVIQQVVDISRSFDAKLHIMNVIPDFGLRSMQEYLPKGWIENLISKSEAALEEIVQEFFPKDMKVNIVVGRGTVYQSILDTAEAARADLIIVCAHRKDTSEYLLGPNAAKVARHAKISVLILREE